MQLAVAALVFGSAAIVTRITGFGFALLSMPIVAALLGPRDAVVASTMLGVVISAITLWHSRHGAVWSIAARLTLGALVGLPLGLLVLDHASESVLKIVIGLVVLLATALIARGQVRVEPRRSVDVAAGVLGGALATSTGVNGPPVVIALQAKGLDPLAFRATIAAHFIAVNTVAIALFGVGGRLTSRALLAAACGVVPLVAGSEVGRRLVSHVDQRRFRRIVLTLLVLSAASAIASVAL